MRRGLSEVCCVLWLLIKRGDNIYVWILRERGWGRTRTMNKGVLRFLLLQSYIISCVAYRFGKTGKNKK